MIANPSPAQLITALYNGLFGRAPEYDGLHYWLDKMNQGQSFEEIATGFTQDSTYQAKFGDLSNEEFVKTLYNNVLGRDPVGNDIDYWTGQIDALGRDKVAATFVKNALTDDPDAIAAANGWTDDELAVAKAAQATTENKIKVGIYFAETLGPSKTALNPAGFLDPSLWAYDPVYKAAQDILKVVTDDPASVAAATSLINTAASKPTLQEAMQVIEQGVATGGGQAFTLTPGVDNIAGTGGNDTIIADNTVSTQLSAADQINGGGGTDTLKIYQASTTGLASTVFGQLSNVENVYINNGTLSNGTTLNVSTLTGVTSIALDSPQAMGDGDTFTLKTASGQGVSLKGVVGTAGSTTSTFSLDGAAEATLDGVGTDLTLDLASAGTSLKLTTAGSASTITLSNTGAALATLNLAGDKAIDITTTVGTLKTVASNSTGDVTIDNTGGAIETYTGAGGKDTLTLVGANVKNVSTGAGNDKVTIATSALAAASAIDLGDGDDSLVVVAGGLANLTSGSQLNGGAGSNDKLVINDTTPAYSKINAAQGFEILGLATTSSTVDVAQLTSINRFSVEATTGASQTFNNAKSTSTFALDNTAGLGTIAISNAVGESATTIAIDNQSATAQTITAVNLTGITQVALSSTGKAGNTITALGNNDNSNIVITGSADLKIANALAGTSTGSKVDASAFTGKLEVTGSSKADILIGGSGNDTITGGNGDDTINLTAGGSDTIVFSAAASNGKDTISGFTAGTGGDLAKVENTDTTASTGSGSIAYATHNVVLVNGAAYSLAGADIGTESGAQTFASSDVIELVGGNEAAANLDAATDGSELLKYLGSTNAATQISVANNGDKAFLVAYDNGKAYLYHADAGADNAIGANEITLVGVFDGVASGAFVSANFQIA